MTASGRSGWCRCRQWRSQLGRSVEQGATQVVPERRWIVEATNSWWSNYGQLRRNTDRRIRHRHAALCLATTILIVGRLLDYRNRWSTAG